MTTNDDRPDPLPREWLPDSPVPPESDDTYWSARLERLMAEAGPVLAEQGRRRAPSISWVEALSLRWRPAAASALALAAAMVLVFVWQTEHATTPDGRAVALSTIVGDGEPAAVWRGAGVEADPTLAFLALESGVQGEGADR